MTLLHNEITYDRGAIASGYFWNLCGRLVSQINVTVTRDETHIAINTFLGAHFDNCRKIPFTCSSILFTRKSPSTGETRSHDVASDGNQERSTDKFKRQIIIVVKSVKPSPCNLLKFISRSRVVHRSSYTFIESLDSFVLSLRPIVVFKNRGALARTKG